MEDGSVDVCKFWSRVSSWIPHSGIQFLSIVSNTLVDRWSPTMPLRSWCQPSGCLQCSSFSLGPVVKPIKQLSYVHVVHVHNTHTHTHTRTYAHAHGCMHTHMNICTCTHMRTRTHARTYTRTHTHKHTHNTRTTHTHACMHTTHPHVRTYIALLTTVL